jgi:hypothetical protein
MTRRLFYRFTSSSTFTARTAGKLDSEPVTTCHPRMARDLG